MRYLTFYYYFRKLMARKRTTVYSTGCSCCMRTVSTNCKPQTPKTSKLQAQHLVARLQSAEQVYSHQKPPSPDWENRNTRPNKLSKPQFPHRPPTYLAGRALSASLNSSGTSRGWTQILLVAQAGLISTSTI